MVYTSAKCHACSSHTILSHICLTNSLHFKSTSPFSEGSNDHFNAHTPPPAYIQRILPSIDKILTHNTNEIRIYQTIYWNHVQISHHFGSETRWNVRHVNVNFVKLLNTRSFRRLFKRQLKKTWVWAHTNILKLCKIYIKTNVLSLMLILQPLYRMRTTWCTDRQC